MRRVAKKIRNANGENCCNKGRKIKENLAHESLGSISGSGREPAILGH
jgi:hypothetical protein